VHSSGVPRCPGGCGAKMPFRLPARSLGLRNAIERLAPEQAEQRRKEALEDEEIDPLHGPCFGGFRPWQEVAANRDVIFGNRVGVRQGTPGIVIGNFSDGLHVTVRFDAQEDGSELCVNVLPEALMEPLPGAFRLGQRVVALYHLMLHDVIGVHMGTVGVVVGGLGADRLMVLFEEHPCDRVSMPEGPVSVNFKEVIAQRPLVGGFNIAQRVQSAMDLIVGDRVAVPAGTRGSVVNEFSDTRLTVAFDQREDGVQSCFNVLPLEIRPWCEPPGHLPAGLRVRATRDLMGGVNTVLVKVGAVGVVLGGVGESHVFVSFASGQEDVGPQHLVVEGNALERAEEQQEQHEQQETKDCDDGTAGASSERGLVLQPPPLALQQLS